MNRNLKIILWFILISWVILAILFGIFDLQISIAVVNESSAWGIFGRNYGEAPGWGLIFICLAILIGNISQNIAKQKIGGGIMLIIAIIVLIVRIIDYDFKSVIDAIVMVASVAIFTLITLKKDWRQYRKFAAVVVLLAIINVLLFVQIIKLLVGRVRFYDLLPDYSNYTPWYVPVGITGNQSFPSGHASMAAMILPCLILLRKREWKDPWRIIGTIVIIGWVFFVAASRVVIGAHYASDVLFSSEFGALITLLLYNHFYLKKSDTS